ncbi:MAG: hypothetical protein HWD92_04965 [Flavobacteriia bacterium]|nr:hypothetical protein [Flavobacteriia bacterium]
MKRIAVIFISMLLFTGCFPDDDDINQGKVETTIRVVSLPGVSPYPNGTSLEIFVKKGPYNNRTYDFLDTVFVTPLVDNPHILEGTLKYEGTLPTIVEIFPTENPQVVSPLGFTNPFNSQSVDFTLKKDEPKEYEIDFLPNFWINFEVYTEQTPAEIGSGLLLIGDGGDFPSIGNIVIPDANDGTDTLSSTIESTLHYGDVTGLYVAAANSDNSDSLLFTLNYVDLVAHDTTYVFYDMDKAELIITQ